MNQYIFGRYPDEEQWRILFSLALRGLAVAVLAAEGRGEDPTGLSCVLTFPFLAATLLLGGEFGWFLTMMSSLAVALFITAGNVLTSYAMGQSIGKVVVALAGMADKTIDCINTSSSPGSPCSSSPR